jgi:hypothetical protein
MNPTIKGATMTATVTNLKAKGLRATRRPSAVSAAAGLVLAGLYCTPLAVQAMSVSDAEAQRIAAQILADYKAERELNVPRWATLAHDEGNAPPANCPTSKTSSGKPVSFKDCNLEYFKLRSERWEEVLQSWAVLSPEQKAKLAPQLNGMFESLPDVQASSLTGQALKKGYAAAGADDKKIKGLGQLGIGINIDLPKLPRLQLPNVDELLGALGLNVEDDTLKTITSMLEGSFLKGKPDVLLKSFGFNTLEDLDRLKRDVEARALSFKGVNGKGFDQTALLGSLQLNKQEADNSKRKLADVTSISQGSRSRAEAVKDITQRIQKLGASGADASLVTAQMAQYEFYLAALDAMGREEQIKAVAQRQGERAEERMKLHAGEARLIEKNIARSTGK